ncbi:TerB family tellurite resistance protein [Chelatococcus composti]|jgi:DnaJ like chaperone protein|uniref:DnaJ like chaperone protein n=1 Tax=Chelatococcus composti TaxID=1743235 RepID=A0A841KB46_9HYPH|nr:TerB family tellurite resistance protein [Chelatococcus composti]MBB6168094.1 DnaJ like chaperone protein [Chelatococcus composti]MBS7734717.1 TerB family tellurite resistance protein [Chelatococcus composti]GGG33630.1 molecular chaperone DjlA [Chelatococcus composti]
MWDKFGWGKLGGAGIGLAIGGPLGALIGALAGHLLIDDANALFRPPPRQVVFTTGLVALAAKMAKADGVVTGSEIRAFHAIIDAPAEEFAQISRLFNIAKATTAGFEAYARQLATLFADEPALLEDVLDGLFLIAAADGALHEDELAYLSTVAAIFGLSDEDFRRIEARHVHRADDPYVILGADRGMSDEELRRLYRKRIAESHPDRQIARGLPAEAVRIATERAAALNAAWDEIVRQRRMNEKDPAETAS